MSKTETIKSYDCVKEIRKVRDRIAHDVKDMTIQETIDYYAKKAKEYKLK